MTIRLQSIHTRGLLHGHSPNDYPMGLLASGGWFNSGAILGQLPAEGIDPTRLKSLPAFRIPQASVEVQRAFRQLRRMVESISFESLPFETSPIVAGGIAYMTEAGALATLSASGNWQGDRAIGIIKNPSDDSAGLQMEGTALTYLEGLASQYTSGDRLFLSDRSGVARRGYPTDYALHVYQIGFLSSFYGTPDGGGGPHPAYITLALDPKRRGTG